MFGLWVSQTPTSVWLLSLFKVDGPSFFLNMQRWGRLPCTLCQLSTLRLHTWGGEACNVEMRILSGQFQEIEGQSMDLPTAPFPSSLTFTSLWECLARGAELLASSWMIEVRDCLPTAAPADSRDRTLYKNLTGTLCFTMCNFCKDIQI